MTWLRRISLQAKFILGLLAIFVILGAAFSLFLGAHLRELLKAEVEDKAGLIFSHQAAIQDYVRTILRPAVRQALPRDEFLLEAMSTSYATRKVMIDLNAETGQYIYRRVALEPRNPDSRANELERQLILLFQKEPHREDYKSFLVIEGEEHYITARPVRFAAECLACHGRPEDAPRELLERYGDGRGFGRTEGEVAGLDLVGLPVHNAVKNIRQWTVSFAVYFFAGTAVVFILILAFFNRLVIHNLRRLKGIFQPWFHREEDLRILDRLDKEDEINTLVRAMEEFALHLGEARRQLEDYAANLEDKVAARTADLSREAGERRSDVQLFVDLLDSLNQSQTRTELLQTCLAQIGRRFGAATVVYYCGLSSQSTVIWPERAAQPEFPPDWRWLVAESQSLFLPDRAFIPVQTSETSRGLLGLFFAGPAAPPEQSREVLGALGQQLGIAMDNLDSLDNLIRQNQLLGSIFEGISDPLLLVDESCREILANDSARRLAGSLSGERPDGGGLLRRLVGAGLGQDDCPLRAMINSGASSWRELSLADNRSFSIRVYPLGGRQSQDRRAVVYVRESTADKRLMAQMQQSEKMIAVGKLAAGMAHEINNPLGVILCYANILRSGLTEGQESADLDIIIKHTKQAQAVLQGLLNFARPKSPAPGPCDLSEAVRGLIDVFKVKAAALRVALDAELGADVPPVLADPAGLDQIITNLVINALDVVAPDTGRVLVRTHHDPKIDRVVLSVADNGPGVDPADMTRIFDPFFTTKEVGKGTGLGLSVVFTLVREMGGYIEVENTPGARFNVFLPAAGDRREAA